MTKMKRETGEVCDEGRKASTEETDAAKLAFTRVYRTGVEGARVRNSLCARIGPESKENEEWVNYDRVLWRLCERMMMMIVHGAGMDRRFARRKLRSSLET